MYLGGLEPSTGRRTPIRACEGLPRNSLKKPTSSVVVFVVRARGPGQRDRPGDDLAVEGRLVGRGDAAGDRLEAGHVSLDPAGDDLDVVDDLARAGRRRRRRGLAEDDDAQRAPSRRRPARRPRRARRAGRRARAPTARARSAGSVFGCSLHDLKLQTPASRPGLRPRFCLPARRDAALGAALHDPGHAASVGLPPGMEATDRAERFHPRRPRLARDRGRRDRARGDQRGPPAVLAARSSTCSRSTLGERRARAQSRPLAGAGASVSALDLALRAQAAAIAAGEVDAGRAARRDPGADRGAQPGDQRRRRDLPRALARDARRRAPTGRCTASRS